MYRGLGLGLGLGLGTSLDPSLTGVHRSIRCIFVVSLAGLIFGFKLIFAESEVHLLNRK